MNVLVLGGKGFIGRYVVRALTAKGCDVSVGTRYAKAANEHALVLHRLIRTEHWSEVVARFDVIVNCAGILRERWGENYADVYHRAPAAIATACATLGKRFIHITALGLHARASSGFLTAKLAGEVAISSAGGATCIVRPSLLDGPDGFGSRWLGGYLTALRTQPAAAIPLSLPAWMVRVAAHALDVLHLTPLSWGHVELMQRDNAPRSEDVQALRHWLGRAPKAVGHVNVERVGRALSAS
jgi:uncharacterized protein YbjT (DUF2867 family)